MAIKSEEFRRALGQWLSGVSVVTVAAEGRAFGMTVSSFASVSLTPPLVSVCLARDSYTLGRVREVRAFGVNVLASGQEALSNTFATGDEQTRFEGVAHSWGQDGVPLLNGALCRLECRLLAAYPAGDHELVVGEVLRTSVSEGAPLAYYRGSYGSFAPGT